MSVNLKPGQVWIFSIEPKWVTHWELVENNTDHTYLNAEGEKHRPLWKAFKVWSNYEPVTGDIDEIWIDATQIKNGKWKRSYWHEAQL